MHSIWKGVGHFLTGPVFSELKRKKGLKAARASVPQHSLSKKATSWPFGVFPFFNSEIWEREGGS